MKLIHLLENIYTGELPDRFRQLEIKSVSCDSRSVHSDSLFVALAGTTSDGVHFIPEAVRKGAAVIVRKTGSSSPLEEADVCTLQVSDPKKFLKDILIRFHGNPSEKVHVIGITGTNGKTTTTYLLESIFHAAGKSCAVIGTVNYRLGKKILPAKNTTPGVVENHLLLTDLIKENVEYCAMEVSSHALEQGRVELIGFKTAVFTNLTIDHLDYHKDMETYFKAKAGLFTGLSGESAAIINIDDTYGKRLVKLTKAKGIGYSLSNKADIVARDLQLDLSGSGFILRTPQGSLDIKTALIGRHNVYNILAASAAALSAGISLENIKQGIEKLKGVPGRLEQVQCGQDFRIFVDYAHTDDALRNVLSSLRDISRARIILVFGCGGDRDRSKRAKMGKVANDLADWSIVTNDNPRSEDPQSIIKQIISGFKNDRYEILPDRKEAIKKAVSLAKPGEIVLIAGKGHEDYQIFKDQTVHFDDREAVKDALHVSH